MKKYASKWREEGVRAFTEEEINAVASNIIEASQYGNSVCFHMVGGGQCYIPCDRGCTKGVGESIDLRTAELKVLSRDGEDYILRVMA